MVRHRAIEGLPRSESPVDFDVRFGAARLRAPLGAQRSKTPSDSVRGGAEFRLPIDWLPRAEGMVRAGTTDAAVSRGSRRRWTCGTLGWTCRWRSPPRLRSPRPACPWTR